jgi:hypothetical protein
MTQCNSFEYTRMFQQVIVTWSAGLVIPSHFECQVIIVMILIWPGDVLGCSIPYTNLDMTKVRLDMTKIRLDMAKGNLDMSKIKLYIIQGILKITILGNF